MWNITYTYPSIYANKLGLWDDSSGNDVAHGNMNQRKCQGFDSGIVLSLHEGTVIMLNLSMQWYISNCATIK